LRLLDHVAQSGSPFLVRQFDGELWQLTGPSDYAREVAGCPLRYVLSDQLVRNCIELAYSDGAGVCGCLDLVHLPAERLWIEWSGVVQREVLRRMMPDCSDAASEECVRHGVLICADAGGRRGSLRTFWLPAAEPLTPLLAPIETLIDLDRETVPASDAEALLAGEALRVRDSRSAEVDGLLECARFRLDPAWQRYYSTVASSPAERRAVLERSLGTVTFDVPALLALFLLMALRSELTHVPISTERINLKRARLGRAPLLAHIEVSCPVFAAPEHRPVGEELTPRTAPRLHHVRGHIVRREDAVFWRRPHWRGHLRLGCVRSRTVNLGLEGALR
jgi:hypothetical protein